MVKYKVRKMAKSLLKHHCYCPMLLMQTTGVVIEWTSPPVCLPIYTQKVVKWRCWCPCDLCGNGETYDNEGQ